MTGTTSFNCLAQVDNAGQVLARVSVAITREDVLIEHGRTHDRAWSFIDAHGHYHAYGRDGVTPTLRATMGPCSGVCGDPEHTEVTGYVCVICGDPVEEPATVPVAPSVRNLEKDRRWSVELQRWPVGLDDFDWNDGRAVVRIFHGDGTGKPTYFGIARLVGDIILTRDGIQGPITLEGIGELVNRA